MKAIFQTPARFSLVVILFMLSFVCLGTAIGIGNSPYQRRTSATVTAPDAAEPGGLLTDNKNTGPVLDPNGVSSLVWTTPIPSSIANGDNPQSGRILAMAVDPSDSNIIYAGGFGGLMKGTYADQTWTWTFLSDGWKSQAVTSIAIDPTSSPNSRIIYAGTGHIDGPRFTRDALATDGQWFNRWFGEGLFRLDSSGWTNLRGPNDAFVGTVITGIVVDPNNGDVYVAQDRLKGTGGLWKLPNHGDDDDWILEYPINPCQFIPGSANYGCDGVFAVELDPSTTPATIYIAEPNGIDQKQGDEWRRIYHSNSCWTWPWMWKIKLKVSQGVPYFLNPNPSPAGGACVNETVNLLSSENAQDTTPVWNVIPTLCSHSGNPCPAMGWETAEINPEVLAVDPSDRRSIFIGGIHTWHVNLPTPVPNRPPTTTWVDLHPEQFHVDLRSVAFSATTPHYVYVGNDGGIWRSQTQSIDQSWENLNQDLPGMILNSAAIAKNVTTGGITLLGGTIDNGCLVYDPQGANSPKGKWVSIAHEPEADVDAEGLNAFWGTVLGGDAYSTLIDPNNPDVFYYLTFASNPYRRSARSHISDSDDITPPGHNCQKWTLTAQPSPNPAHIVLPCEAGPNPLISRTWNPDVYKFSNIFWQDLNSPVKMSIAREAPSDSSIIYAVEYCSAPLDSLCDPKIYVATNAPTPNASATPGATPTWSPGEHLYNKHVRALTIHPTNPQIAYLACYEGIWKTTNMGNSWFPLTFDDKVNLDYTDLAIDPNYPDMIFASGSGGVFMSVTGGVQNDWTFMPSIPKGMTINSLSFDSSGLTLIAAAIGRGVYWLDLTGYVPPPVTPTPGPTRSPSPTPSPTPSPSPSPTPSPSPSPTRTPSPTPTPSPSPTRTPSPTPTPSPSPTRTPSPTPTPSPSPTRTPSPTPSPSPSPTRTPTPSPTPTPMPTPTPGLVAGYSLNETGSPVSDCPNHNLPGTVQGPSPTAGKYGNALKFNGNGDYVALPTPPAFNITGSMTLSAWVKITANPEDDANIINKGNTSSGWQFKTSKDRGPRLFCIKVCGTLNGTNQCAQQYSVSAEPLVTNQWYHVAGVYSAGTSASLTIYVDGNQKNGDLVGTIPSSQTATTMNALIGKRSDPNGFYFNGLIDNVRIYNKALNSTEIQADKDSPISCP